MTRTQDQKRSNPLKSNKKSDQPSKKSILEAPSQKKAKKLDSPKIKPSKESSSKKPVAAKPARPSKTIQATREKPRTLPEVKPSLKSASKESVSKKVVSKKAVEAPKKPKKSSVPAENLVSKTNKPTGKPAAKKQAIKPKQEKIASVKLPEIVPETSKEVFHKQASHKEADQKDTQTRHRSGRANRNRNRHSGHSASPADSNRGREVLAEKKKQTHARPSEQPQERIVGFISILKEGYGFVTPEFSKERDIFIPADEIANAFDQDKVLVEVRRFHPVKKRKEGRVLEVLERRMRRVVGIFSQTSSGPQVLVEGRGKRFFVDVNPQKTLKAENQERVLVQIEEYPEEGRRAAGSVIKRFGTEVTLSSEIEVIFAQHQLESEFPKEVVSEAKKIPLKISEEEIKNRRDLRKMPLVTIDGENAQDFDDAVFVERSHNGYTLYVAIADVSHYVTLGTALDAEAFSRATSTYFPHGCVPMLPEKLSNNLCSLKPHQNRLCFVSEMHFDFAGVLVRSEFYKAVMRSHARLTYKQVHRMMIDGDVELREEHHGLVPHLESAFGLYELLKARRKERGSIDFDLPEPEFIIDVEEGVASSIIRSSRTAAHMLIEEFMIAANESVGGFMAARKLPMVYRIHEVPSAEKIENFASLMRRYGETLPPIESLTPKHLASIVQKVRGTKHERLINTLLLRSLKQAVYSTLNVGHFGLASADYTHFTSPIRRYPDLIVHRLLAAALAEPKKKKPTKSAALENEGLLKDLEARSKHCSTRERAAMQVEWEVRDLHVALFMQDKLGEEFSGIISSVTAFGFFVELEPYFVEGLVRVQNIRDDYYVFDEKRHSLQGRRTKRRFEIGSAVKVKLAKVDLLKRKLDFELVK